jgi:acyl-coenzyme A thioesterase 13
LSLLVVFTLPLQIYLTYCIPFGLIVQEEIEVEGKLLRAGKSVGVVSVDFRKKRTGKLMAQARHTKYLAVSSRL